MDKFKENSQAYRMEYLSIIKKMKKQVYKNILEQNTVAFTNDPTIEKLERCMENITIVGNAYIGHFKKVKGTQKTK